MRVIFGASDALAVPQSLVIGLVGEYENALIGFR